MFVHLHTHSHFSLLEAVPSPRDLVRRAAQLGMPAVALTDRNGMFGAARFYREAVEAGVRPILGCQLSLGPGRGSVVALARDMEGYRHLCRLATVAATASVRQGPGVSRDDLWRFGDGLIVLSGGREGELAGLVAQGREEEAWETARAFRERFGPDGFYIELEDLGLPGQRDLNRKLIELARRADVGLVATNDVRFIHPGQAAAYAALRRLASQTDRTFPAGPESREAYFKSGAEMAALFEDVPEALSNTARIAEMCQLDLGLGIWRLPSFSPGGQRSDVALARAAREGARRRFGDALPDPVERRLEHEISIIGRMGMADYFLLLADVVGWAKDRGIPVGPGRGSAAGSLVAYCLRITEVDPLAHGLLFERFLNPTRREMPDIDIDVCDDRRSEVLEYVRQRLGPERVSHIAAFATFAARAAVRETGRAMGVPAERVDRLARLIPKEPGMTLAASIDAVPELGKARRDPQLGRLLAAALLVEGAPRHVSVHAAGVVVGPGPLELELPLIQGAGGPQLTQYPMEDLEALGYVKVDFLGLRTLTVIRRAKDLIAHRGGTVPEPLPLDDPAVYRMLSSGGTEGVFQLETRAFRRLTERMRPARFADLVALLALGRPGPGHRIETFLRRRRGQEKVVYLHPLLEPILRETEGIILYQEQVMRIAMDMAGFSPEQADNLRKGMAKKQPELLAAERNRFVSGAAARGVSREVAEQVFAELVRFGGYGFNKSHSVAYALISYETAYLRAHYPAEFLAAQLSSAKGDPDRIRRYEAACRRMGVRVLPPDINESDVEFTVTGDGEIRFGLAAIRHVGRPLAEAIVAARGAVPYESLADLCRRVGGRLSRPALLALVSAGACDCFGESRERMAAAAGALLDGPSGSTPFGQTAMFASAEAEHRPVGEPPADSDMLDGEGPAVVIDLPADAGPAVQRLRRVLGRNRGPVPVIVRLPAGGAKVSVLAGRNWWVRPAPELWEALSGLARDGGITGFTRLP